MLPYLGKHVPQFAFLVHPRGIEDVHRHDAGAFLREYSTNESELKMKISSLPPLVLGEVKFGFSTIRGELICINLFPEDMMGRQARTFIVQAANLAEGRGAKVIGLGALTSPATGGGVRLLANVTNQITLTNGNAYTAAVIRSNVMEAITHFDKKKHIKVAIVGCTGSVGVPTTKLLAEKDVSLILIGRSLKKIKRQLAELENHALFSDSIDSIKEADIIVLLTSDTSAQITASQVRFGSIIIDCAQPSNIHRSKVKGFHSRGVQVIQGGLVRIPGYSCSYDFQLPDKSDTFACLAETYMFARGGIQEHSTGLAQHDLSCKLERLALKYGINPSPLNLN